MICWVLEVLESLQLAQDFTTLLAILLADSIQALLLLRATNALISLRWSVLWASLMMRKARRLLLVRTGRLVCPKFLSSKELCPIERLSNLLRYVYFSLETIRYDLEYRRRIKYGYERMLGFQVPASKCRNG